MADPDYSTEIWKPIPFASEYEASSLGRVRRMVKTKYTEPGHIIRLHAHHSGYISTAIFYDGRFHNLDVHRLVAFAFLGPPPSPKHHAAHNDGDRTNNTATNLRWATVQENAADVVRHGSQKGERNNRCKLTRQQVRTIRAQRCLGATYASLAREFNVTKTAIKSVVKRESWAWLD